LARAALALVVFGAYDSYPFGPVGVPRNTPDPTEMFAILNSRIFLFFYEECGVIAWLFCSQVSGARAAAAAECPAAGRRAAAPRRWRTGGRTP